MGAEPEGLAASAGLLVGPTERILVLLESELCGLMH